MSWAVGAFLVLTLLTGAVLIARGTLRRDAPVWFGLLLVQVLALAWFATGLPRIVLHREWLSGKRVHATHYDAGRAIYVWTAERPPVSFQLPWDEGLARSLQETTQRAKQRGHDGIIVWYDERTDDFKAKLPDLPQLPSKTDARPTPAGPKRP